MNRKEGQENTPAPEGYPDARRILLDALKDELERLKSLIEGHIAVDPHSEVAKGLSYARERFRAAIWDGARVRDEKPPETVARLLGLSADAVRYWCRKGYVEHRKTKSGRYLVDVQSALDYYACS